MNRFGMSLEVVVGFELFPALNTLVCDGIDIVLIVYMYPQCLRGRGFMITKMAGVRFDPEVDGLDMPG